jgi:hypothetical protein
MRKPLLLAPIALALAIPLTAASQDAPRVLFCSGGCFAVDAKGVRTPAPKGTVLRPGQRLETSAGAYAQVKLSPATAVGISEQASIRLDQNAVVLDQGRIRMVGAQAFGKPITQPVELRTLDGTVVLRGADIEAKKTDIGRATPTLVRVNAGDARLGKGPGEIRLPTQAVQGITTGKLAGAPIPITEFLPAEPAKRQPSTTTPVRTAVAPIIVPTTLTLEPLRIDTSLSTMTTLSTTSTLTRTLDTSLSITSTELITKPALTSADSLLNTQLVSPDTGTLVKVTDVLKADTTTQPVVYEAPRTAESSPKLEQRQTCNTCTQTEYQFQR